MRWGPQEKGVEEGSREGGGQGCEDGGNRGPLGRVGNSIQFMDHFMDKGRG